MEEDTAQRDAVAARLHGVTTKVVASAVAAAVKAPPTPGHRREVPTTRPLLRKTGGPDGVRSGTGTYTLRDAPVGPATPRWGLPVTGEAARGPGLVLGTFVGSILRRSGVGPTASSLRRSRPRQRSRKRR